ncbi:MAG: VCBS repeat-containing protein, partial [Sedimentisphaerales bacterium]|nr:VCBS repeat-containing protein [Sedimentisphaerales bacterium]
MQLLKMILIVILICPFTAKIYAQETETDDLSAYYGFKEIEIIKLDWGIKDLRIADFNGDGRNDIAIANNRKARIELLLQKETLGLDEAQVAVDPADIDVNAIVAPTRFARESVSVSQKLFSLVCGDFNSDGLADMAFYGEPKGLYILLQKTAAGKRDSLSWQTRKKIQIDDGLLTSNALACADLNHDGTDDLALVGRDGVYIIVQKKDGSLAEPEKYPTSAQTLGVEMGDLNGDGINDLILITNDNEKPLHVRFGLKTGKFGPLQRFFIEPPSALMAHATDEATGDDILAVDRVSGRLICYQLSTEDSSAADWPILFYPLASGQEDTKRDLVVGDFNGDGLADVAISDPGAAEIIFYKQAANIGLVEPVRFPAFADSVSLSAKDIDGDGKDELGILSVKEKVVGLSTFENDRLSFPQPVNLTGEPLAMELADIDGDGATDCIYVAKEGNDRTLRTIQNVSLSQNEQ